MMFPTTTEEIYEHLKKDIASNKIVEVFTGSAENETGIHRLLKSIRHDCPSHEETIKRNQLKLQITLLVCKFLKQILFLIVENKVLREYGLENCKKETPYKVIYVYKGFIFF